MRTRYMFCAMAMVGLALSGAAAGGTVSAQFTGGSPWAPVTVTYTDVNNHRHSESTYAGLYWFQRTDTPGLNGADVSVSGTFSAFCMDVQESITWGPTYTWDVAQNIVGMAPTPTPPGGTITQTQLTALGKLYSGYYNGGDFSSNVAAAGFGAAVWEVVWENPAASGYHVTSGLFSINSGDVATQAQHYLDNLPDTDAYSGNLVGLVSHGAQDQIVVVLTGGNDNHSPEPLTILGVLGSAAAIAAYIRRRRGQASGSTSA